jgi:hypothetical protein
MKIMEIVDSVLESSLFEMAFQRKVIINRLRDLQFQINRHVMKIIVWPSAQEVPHWKRELTGWGNDLTAMTLRAGRGARPMGFDLALETSLPRAVRSFAERTDESSGAGCLSRASSILSRCAQATPLTVARPNGRRLALGLKCY